MASNMRDDEADVAPGKALAHFMPHTIGTVRQPSASSPFTSAMSFCSSRTRVLRKAKAA